VGRFDHLIDWSSARRINEATKRVSVGLFKASVRSTHVQISAKHMDRYLSEFNFRASNRQRVNGMCDLPVGAL